MEDYPMGFINKFSWKKFLDELLKKTFLEISEKMFVDFSRNSRKDSEKIKVKFPGKFKECQGISEDIS